MVASVVEPQRAPSTSSSCLVFEHPLMSKKKIKFQALHASSAVSIERNWLVLDRPTPDHRTLLFISTTTTTITRVQINPGINPIRPATFLERPSCHIQDNAAPSNQSVPLISTTIPASILVIQKWSCCVPGRRVLIIVGPNACALLWTII